MKPLPTPHPEIDMKEKLPGLPINPDPSTYSTTNRKAPSCALHSAYPWLLFASTTIAATFCLAYITKPYLIESPTDLPTLSPRTVATANTPTAPQPQTSTSLLPSPDALPGENLPTPPTSREAPPAPGNDFEETNIRVQHILDAESPSGDISRIIVDVPVLYHSRNLRWSQQQAAEARELLTLLTTHQEKTRALREEGTRLLTAWDNLIARSIPTDTLRADSPSLPENQYKPLTPQSPPSTDTLNTLELQNPQD